MRLRRTVTLAAVAASLVVGGAPGARAQQGITLNGAGATFPYPLYSKWA